MANFYQSMNTNWNGAGSSIDFVPDSDVTCGVITNWFPNPSGTTQFTLQAGNGSINTGSNYYYGYEGGGGDGYGIVNTSIPLSYSGVTSGDVQMVTARFWNLNVAAAMYIEFSVIGTGTHLFYGAGVINIENCDRIRITMSNSRTATNNLYFNGRKSTASVLIDSSAASSEALTGGTGLNYDEFVFCTSDNASASSGVYDYARVVEDGSEHLTSAKWEQNNNASSARTASSHICSDAGNITTASRGMFNGFRMRGTGREHDGASITSYATALQINSNKLSSWNRTCWGNSVTKLTDVDGMNVRSGGGNWAGTRPRYIVGYFH